MRVEFGRKLAVLGELACRDKYASALSALIRSEIGLAGGLEDAGERHLF